MSEVAISTYKHIGRIRSARLIGRDLASFYVKIGEPQKASNFLADQLKTFIEEGWPLLTAQTQSELAKCYLATGDTEKYIKCCAQLAASSVISEEKRHLAFKDMTDAVEESSEGKQLLISSDRIFEVQGLKVISEGEVILDSKVQIQLVITSNLPAGVSCQKVVVMLKHIPESQDKQTSGQNSSKRNSDIERKCSSSSSSSSQSRPQAARRSNSDAGEAESRRSAREDDDDAWQDDQNSGNQNLSMSLSLEYKQDKSLSTASVLCSNPHKVLRRRDSHSTLYSTDRSVVKEALEDYLLVENVTIRPGKNTLTLTTMVTKRGSYIAGQVILATERVEFVCGKSSVRCPPLSLEVVSENPKVFLGRKDRDLLAGLLQPMVLTIHSGSRTIAEVNINQNFTFFINFIVSYLILTVL